MCFKTGGDEAGLYIAITKYPAFTDTILTGLSFM